MPGVGCWHHCSTITLDGDYKELYSIRMSKLTQAFAHQRRRSWLGCPLLQPACPQHCGHDCLLLQLSAMLPARADITLNRLVPHTLEHVKQMKNSA